MSILQSKSLSFSRQISKWKTIQNFVVVTVCARTWTSASKESSPAGVKPVKLAYTSYESTEPLVANSVPILILHGLLGSKNNWNSLSKSFYSKTKRKIVNVDARNHGTSPFSNEMSYHHMTADVRALMEDLEIKKASIIGHSMGGRTAINLALRYPDEVESLIVLDISPFGMGSGVSNISKVVNALLAVKIEPNITLPKARLLADRQLSTSITDLAMRQFVLTQLYEDENGNYKWRANVDVIQSNIDRILTKFPLDDSLRYHGPTLFIIGSKSDYVRPEHHAGIKKLFPKAEIKSIDSGHWPHAEKPAEFLEMATQFLTSKR